jgi:hypothetical protein
MNTNLYAYIKLLTKEYPRFQGDIRLEHPEIGDVFSCPNTYAEVYNPEILVVAGENEIAREEQPLQINGKWIRQFTLIPYVHDQEIPKKKPPFKFSDKPKVLDGKSKIFPTEATGRIEITILGQTK